MKFLYFYSKKLNFRAQIVIYIYTINKIVTTNSNSFTKNDHIMGICKIELLREHQFSSIEKKPGYYRWWFKKEAAEQLIRELYEWLPEADKFLTEVIYGEEYIALYFGISKNLKGRIKWHASQKHTPSAISRGLLSTLRQTLSALLKEKMSVSYETINEFMDENCIWEWEYSDTYADAQKVESDILRNQEHYYPLNIKENHTVNKDILKWLKGKRSLYRC